MKVTEKRARFRFSFILSVLNLEFRPAPLCAIGAARNIQRQEARARLLRQEHLFQIARASTSIIVIKNILSYFFILYVVYYCYKE